MNEPSVYDMAKNWPELCEELCEMADYFLYRIPNMIKYEVDFGAPWTRSDGTIRPCCEEILRWIRGFHYAHQNDIYLGLEKFIRVTVTTTHDLHVFQMNGVAFERMVKEQYDNSTAWMDDPEYKREQQRKTLKDSFDFFND